MDENDEGMRMLSQKLAHALQISPERRLELLAKQLKQLRGLDPELHILTAQILVFLRENEDACAADIQKEFEISQPAAARHLQRLGTGSPGSSAAVGKGLRLVEWHPDPMDSRRRLHTLTKAGQVAVLQLMNPLGRDKRPASERQS